MTTKPVKGVKITTDPDGRVKVVPKPPEHPVERARTAKANKRGAAKAVPPAKATAVKRKR